MVGVIDSAGAPRIVLGATTVREWHTAVSIAPVHTYLRTYVRVPRSRFPPPLLVVVDVGVATLLTYPRFVRYTRGYRHRPHADASGLRTRRGCPEERFFLLLRFRSTNLRALPNDLRTRESLSFISINIPFEARTRYS